MFHDHVSRRVVLTMAAATLLPVTAAGQAPPPAGVAARSAIALACGPQASLGAPAARIDSPSDAVHVGDQVAVHK